MHGSKRAWATLLGGAALLVASLTFVAPPARAADDGYAPLWDGIGQSIGILPGKSDDSIDYQPRGRLVLPKTNALPPPVASKGQGPAWPRDPDVAAAKQAKLEALKSTYLGPTGGKTHATLNPGTTNLNMPATVSATAGQGPGEPLCNMGEKTCAGGTPADSILRAIGMSNTALGPEPPRAWLTDPPQGYRAPVHPVAQATPTPAQ